ncbi:MAG: hypothetical protein QOD96_6347 [Pseudonocardiales bacterium]|nr:hypothetical protein [Pseudonocardiales bacterium]
MLEHSHRVGVNPRRYTFLTGAEQWRSDLPAGPTFATAGHPARSMSWTAMVDLFTDAVARVTSEPAE